MLALLLFIPVERQPRHQPALKEQFLYPFAVRLSAFPA